MDQSIKEQAAEWFLRITSEDPKPTAEDYQEFENWQAQDMRHAQAFASMESFVQGMETLPKSASVDTLKEVIHKTKYQSKSGVLSLLLFIFLAGAGFFALPQENIEYLFADIKTEENSGLAQTLADSSSLTLASNSAVNIDFDRQQRRIKLIDGQLLVDVAKDPQRPFVVSTRHGNIRVLGTKFIVDKQASTTTLTVLESNVAVYPANQQAEFDLIVVPAGQQLVFNGRTRQELREINVQQSERAWKNSQLVVDAEPLPAVLKRLSAHYNERLFYSNTELQQVEVTAVLPMNDLQAALNLLADSLPIEIQSYFSLATTIRIKEEKS